MILEPAVLHFGSLSRNATTFREARLRQREGLPFTLKSVMGAERGCEVTWVPVEKSAGGGYVIKALVRGLPPGVFSQVLQVNTDSTSMPELRLTLAGEVESDLKCIPAVGVAKAGIQGGVAKIEIVIEHMKAEPFRVRSVRESRNLPIQFSVAETGAGRRSLTIELSELPGEGAPIGEFLIQVDSQEEPVHLPYRMEPSDRKAQGKP
jgi:hypothetical protein